ncbi:hypothetical protein BH09MYX1_BH09MYX1_10780 [soil metagenome]
MNTGSAESELLVLLAKQRAAFRAFVRGRVGSGAEADDLLQQALLRATEKVATLRDGERVQAWFYRVLRNAIADHHAARARHEARLAPLSSDADAPIPEDANMCGCSVDVLRKLRPEYATILTRIDLEDEPIDDAARALGITANNAKVRLHRARNALRRALLAYCNTDSVRACATCSCS